VGIHVEYKCFWYRMMSCLVSRNAKRESWVISKTDNIAGYMNATMRAFLIISIAITTAMAFAFSAMGQRMHSPSSTDSPIDPKQPTGQSALRQIVQEQCVLNWQKDHNPVPCERVFLADPKDGGSGYAVIAAPGGGAHYLLVPTRTMAGIESSELLDPDAPNYFAEAWRARGLLGAFVGHDVPRTAVGLVVGIVQSRAQDQFHIHIECLQQDAFAVLRASADNLGDVWSPITIAGSTYQARRIVADGLDAANLFELLATLNPDARHHLGNYTLIVAGMQFKSGPGFVVLTGTGPSGEILLDSSCAVAGGGG
jgi:CDP-diacylglycerol pyrophosphatase